MPLNTTNFGAKNLVANIPPKRLQQGNVTCIARTFDANVLAIQVKHGANISVPNLCAVKFSANNTMMTYDLQRRQKSLLQNAKQYFQLLSLFSDDRVWSSLLSLFVVVQVHLRKLQKTRHPNYYFLTTQMSLVAFDLMLWKGIKIRIRIRIQWNLNRN